MRARWVELATLASALVGAPVYPRAASPPFQRAHRFVPGFSKQPRPPQPRVAAGASLASASPTVGRVKTDENGAEGTSESTSFPGGRGPHGVAEDATRTRWVLTGAVAAVGPLAQIYVFFLTPSWNGFCSNSNFFLTFGKSVFEKFNNFHCEISRNLRV